MFNMLKKLASGEYSLKVTFWLFGLCGTFLFYLLVNITHNGLLRLICSYGRSCVKSVLLYILGNFPLLMTGTAKLTISAFVPHLLLSSLFVCYLLLLVRGLWKSSDVYEGSRFWSVGAKIIVIGMVLLGLKSVI